MRLSVNSSAFYRGAQPRPSRFPWAYDTMLPQHRAMIEQNLRLEPGVLQNPGFWVTEFIRSKQCE